MATSFTPMEKNASHLEGLKIILKYIEIITTVSYKTKSLVCQICERDKKSLAGLRKTHSSMAWVVILLLNDMKCPHSNLRWQPSCVCVCVYIYNIMVTIIGSGHSDPSSNHGWGYLHST